MASLDSVSIAILLGAVLVMAGYLTYKGATAPVPISAVGGDRAQMGAQTLPPLARRGLEVYEEQGCAACHVVRGAGGAGGPDLTRIGRERDQAWLKGFIPNASVTNASSEMPPYDTLAPEDLDALVAYLRTLQ